MAALETKKQTTPTVAELRCGLDGGSQEPWAAFYGQARGRLRWIAAGFAKGDAGKVEDIVQDGWVRTLAEVRRGRVTDGNLEGYVARLTTNEAISVYRKERKAIEVPMESISDRQDSSLASPEDEVVERVTGEELLIALRDGGISDQRIGMLLDFESGKSCDEIAQERGIARGTVLSNLNRGRTAAREILLPLVEPSAIAGRDLRNRGNRTNHKSGRNS